MATFYTSEVTGYEGTNGWVSLSDGYPDRLKVTYSTAIDSSGKVNVTWKVEGNASEGAKSSSTYTKIYACTLTIDGTKVLSKTWTSGNLYHGTVLGSGTHSLAASKAGTSINIVADAIIYGSATHSKKTQAVTLPTPNKLRLAYHPNGGTLGNTSTYSLNKYGYITDKNTGDWDFHTVYYPNKVNPRNATTNSNNHFYLTKTGYTFKCWSPILNNVV